ncbi:hypothetical protein AJ80_06561 [Polytolypa hystricis UAMH7299]|uniref:Integral membrane protein n=1 Tax=Polytolypa hystricis (strain UAMH7299) TaxID=1447883 RepID=A0A2B7XW47_POLH7|nr:hypothetical protein AJ80_06561 [Polytolypa hystricis UAMH7299]
MPSQISQSSLLSLAAHLFATTWIGFGINAIVRPSHALTFFEFSPPTNAADKRMVDSLLFVYGARDIFMGVAIFSAAMLGGSRKSLGLTLLATGAVAFADGYACYTHGSGGEWNHWGYAPVVSGVGALLMGIFDHT